MSIISKECLRTYWSKGEKIRVRGKSYRVGKMSYGAWFLEPKKDRGEREPFNHGTLWPEHIPDSNNYKI